MRDIILHHHAFSTFSEKVRVALGLKGLAYRSVDIPGMPPRPLLEPLTGGRRPGDCDARRQRTRAGVRHAGRR